MSDAYRINLTPDDNGTFLVTAPSLPEVTTFGMDEAEARRNGLEAVLEAIAARMSEWIDIPADGVRNDHPGPTLFVSLPLLACLKVDLYRSMRQEGVTRAELTRRLGWASREQVDRLFRLDHASRLDQLEAAAAAIGRTFEVELVSDKDDLVRAI